MGASGSGAEQASTPTRALEAHELGRIEAAAHHAERVYPGPVGELIARELRAHAAFGYRFGGGGLALRVARSLLSMPVPSEVPDRASGSANR